MKIINLIFLLFISTTFCNAQNLVQNPSFELSISSALHWYKPPNDGNTPDHYSWIGTRYYGGPGCNIVGNLNCWGGNLQNAFGNKFIGLGLYYIQGGQHNGRENIMTELSSPLIADTKYKVGFYVKHAERTRYIINHIGLFLSDTAIGPTNSQALKDVIPVTPQLDINRPLGDSTHWTRVEMEYYADGGERFLTIGNFTPDSLLQISLNPLNDPADTNCLFAAYSAYYFIDSVYVIPEYPLDVTDVVSPEINIYPNPANEVLNIANVSNAKVENISVYNILGELQFLNSLTLRQIQIRDLPNGLYFVRIATNKGTLSKKIFVKH